MATFIRFAIRQPLQPNLRIDSVPADFNSYVWDVDVSTVDGQLAAGRMRYMGQPYRVIELGPIER